MLIHFINNIKQQEWALSVPVLHNENNKTLSNLEHIRKHSNIQERNKKQLEQILKAKLKWRNWTLIFIKIKKGTSQTLIRFSTKFICQQPQASRYSTTESLVYMMKIYMTVFKTASRNIFKPVNIRDQSMVDQTSSQWSIQPLEFISRYMTILAESQSKWLRQQVKWFGQSWTMQTYNIALALIWYTYFNEHPLQTKNEMW